MHVDIPSPAIDPGLGAIHAFNNALAHAQAEGLQILLNLIRTEQDPLEQRRLLAILMRIRPRAIPATAAASNHPTRAAKSPAPAPAPTHQHEHEQPSPHVPTPAHAAPSVLSLETINSPTASPASAVGTDTDPEPDDTSADLASPAWPFVARSGPSASSAAHALAHPAPCTPLRDSA